MTQNFNRVKRNYQYLKILSSCNKKMRNSIINGGTKDLIDTLCECILNLLNGNLNLDLKDKNNLSKYKLPLRKLLKRISLKEKKKILVQKGGFLEILLPSIVSGLATIIGSAISSS